MLPRLFLDVRVEEGALVWVSGEDGHHFSRVLRARPGEALVVCAANGPFRAEVAAVRPGEICVHLRERAPSSEPRRRLILVQGLAKGDKMDAILQKCTEIGAWGFVVFEAERSVVKLSGAAKVEQKLARWRKVVREAAMQAQRDVVPFVAWAQSFSASLAALGAHEVDHVLVLDEEERDRGIRSAIRGGPENARIAVVVGPEGGLARGERQMAKEDARCLTVTLGPRILRTETAGAVAIAIALAESGDMGG
ncbi:RsmE family RNA methyltransferase [Alicyclobacillus sendaiensis]|uniref:Ribosomal RNA small subunit methyltransferase E n=1 Tax=Alicyclobacillus sendaiensis PA2 TaxID=3029425 RepID=A0ABT6XX28_ALISE|nr:RsmE family RNA methyltransferase [Alicyclobacillus sendaiensis]MDI9259337.1 RsmE family RNA methyltransferase [Alicyclobacillus sendaiensis PA2]